MPITYQIDEQESLVITEIVGKVLLEEIFAYQDQLLVDPRGRSCTKSLIDLAASTPVDGSPEWMRSISTRSSGLEDSLEKMAVVAPDALRYGLSRAYEAYASEAPYETHVFRTRAEAEEWLAS